MATKPNETYKWGENATHEQVAAYEDTGWPSDVIPPKRTQFNWYQNLVGKWLGWAEEAVDELVGTVLDAWFVEVNSFQSVPHKTGIYKHDIDHRFYLVHGDHMATVGVDSPYFTANWYTWIGSQWVEASAFTRSNTRTDILQESEANYVTPKGLVDYFRTADTASIGPLVVPHQTGVYTVGSVGSQTGVALVSGDVMFFQRAIAPIGSFVYLWEDNEWVEQT